MYSFVVQCSQQSLKGNKPVVSGLSGRPGLCLLCLPYVQGHRKGSDRDEPEKDKGKKGKKKSTAGPRIVHLSGGNEVEGLPVNSVKTAKYNVVTFLPIFLWEMFSRVAYLYFLLQVRDPLKPSLFMPDPCLGPIMQLALIVCALQACPGRSIE